MRIRKAVIPAAGMGTRFLPATKAIAKELLPIVDIPTLQYIIDEAAASGIEEILLIISREKDMITKHFTKDDQLEHFLHERGKDALVEKVRAIDSGVKLSYLYQDEPLGLGHAVSLAEEFVGGEPFAVLLGDDVVASDDPALAQLIRAAESENASVIGVQQVPMSRVHKYGVVAPKSKLNDTLHEVAGFVEKPAAEEAPSNLAILGRYVLSPTIFELLRHTEPGKGGEIQLTDALDQLVRKEKTLACEFSGRRYDVGDQLGFIEANIEYGLKRADIGEALASYLQTLTKTLQD